MTVQEILRSKGSEVITIRRDALLSDLARLLSERRIGAALVMADGQILGVVSERDAIHALAAHGARALTMTIEAVMTRDVVVCAPTDTIHSVMATMTERRMRHVPVVDGGKLVGLVSIGDVVKYRVEEIESEANMLRDYVQAR